MKKRILKYLRILYKGIMGIGVEFLYPIVILSLAFLISGFIYFSFIFKK